MGAGMRGGCGLVVVRVRSHVCVSVAILAQEPLLLASPWRPASLASMVCPVARCAGPAFEIAEGGWCRLRKPLSSVPRDARDVGSR